MASYSENDTWYAGLGGTFNLSDDRVRATVGAFYGHINYRFWGIGSDAGNQDEYAEIKQEIPVAVVEAMYRIFDGGYLGLGYIGGKSDTTMRLNGLGLPPGFDTIKDTLQIGAVEVPFQYDTRDNQMYPRKGWLVDASAILYRESVGSDFNSENYSIGANSYIKMRENDVLAFRG
jgi:hypothetical protein